MQEVSEAPLFEEITEGGLTDKVLAQASANPITPRSANAKAAWRGAG